MAKPRLDAGVTLIAPHVHKTDELPSVATAVPPGRADQVFDVRAVGRLHGPNPIACQVVVVVDGVWCRPVYFNHKCPDAGEGYDVAENVHQSAGQIEVVIGTGIDCAVVTGERRALVGAGAAGKDVVREEGAGPNQSRVLVWVTVAPIGRETDRATG